METRQINNVQTYVATLLTEGKKPQLFIKTTPVNTRVAQKGETVETILKGPDGELYIERTVECDEGYVVITNPGGEQYVNTPEEFNERYIVTQEGQVMPKATPRVLLQIEESISFTDPWNPNEQAILPSGGFLNIGNKNDIYPIAQEQLYQTHLYIGEIQEEDLAKLVEDYNGEEKI